MNVKNLRLFLTTCELKSIYFYPKRARNMEISDKLLVEQAWALQEKLKRQIELKCNPFRLERTICGVVLIRKYQLNYAHEHAYSRYLRRLKKYWALSSKKENNFL